MMKKALKEGLRAAWQIEASKAPGHTGINRLIGTLCENSRWIGRVFLYQTSVALMIADMRAVSRSNELEREMLLRRS